MKKYFEGLDSLRFYAAILVVLFHITKVINRYNIYTMPDLPIFYKADAAVFSFV